MYEDTFTVMFKDTDRSGRIFYPRLFEKINDTEETLLDEVGWSYQRILDMENKFPVVHADADFSRPLVHGMTVEITVNVTYGESSVTFAITGTVDEEDVFTAEVVHCFVDAETMEPQPLPDEFCEVLENI